MRKSLFLVLVVSSVACGCGQPEPEPEAFCFGDADCGGITPVCTPFGAQCTHSCTSSVDCSDLVEQTSCDEGLCTAPCAGDSVGVYACVEGDRIRCEEDATLSCAICPAVCGSDGYCDGVACQPQRVAGSVCHAHIECTSGLCTGGTPTVDGTCAAVRGEACTDETCAVCLQDADGVSSYCTGRCDSSCSGLDAAGQEWFCITLSDDNSYCVPVGDCSFEGQVCAPFANAHCSRGYNSSGTFLYCLPDQLTE